MRISDWSSDVCSSDLSLVNHALAILGLRLHGRRVDLLDILECVAAGRQRDRCGLRLLGSVAILDFLRRHRFSPGANKIDRSPVAVRYNTFTDCTKRASSALESSSRSDEHTSELQSLMRISYAVFCLKKKNTS